jgi:E1A/CREB-binding protein
MQQQLGNQQQQPQPGLRQMNPNGPGMGMQMQNMPRQMGPGGMNQGNLAGLIQSRMPMNAQSQNMFVSPSGPSPNSMQQHGNTVLPGGLSPFGQQQMGNHASGMTPPSQNNQFQNGPQLPNTTSPGGLSQFNEIMNEKYKAGDISRQQQQQQNAVGMNNGIGGGQTVMPSMPSPFSGSMQSQNAFGGGMQMSNQQQQQRNSLGQMPPTPTNVGDMMSSSGGPPTVGLPSPSPSLTSNGPIPPVSTPNPPSVIPPVSTPNPPSVQSPPPLPTPISTPPNSALQTSIAGSMAVTSTASSGALTATSTPSGGTTTSTISSMKITSRSSSLSSQMAALEAANRNDDEDSPESNTNKGKEIKQEDDIKDDPDMESGGGGGKNVNNDGKSIKQEIKTEPMDQDGDSQDTNKSKLDIRIKDEPMSPKSSDAVVKSEVKTAFPEPIANSDSKKKKCCK